LGIINIIITCILLSRAMVAILSYVYIKRTLLETVVMGINLLNVLLIMNRIADINNIADHLMSLIMRQHLFNDRDNSSVGHYLKHNSIKFTILDVKLTSVMLLNSIAFVVGAVFTTLLFFIVEDGFF